MQTLVTGVAGFIGSHLAESLLAEGHEVTGLDCFTPYYSAESKRDNIARLLGADGFTLREIDLRTDEIASLLGDVDVVFHQAGQPGARPSWADDFPAYVDNNVLATQRLLEAVRQHPVNRVVYASSSSVYGNAPRYPTSEDDLPRPHSPYGVTKLAAEHLCHLYADNWGVSVAALRYFTVYGPRQRPDMAISRFIQASLTGATVTVYGDGEQIRDFTHVDDVVRANLAAATADDVNADPINISGGGSITVNALLDLIGAVGGNLLDRQHVDPAPGDVRQTGGSIELAHRVLGWTPTIDLEEGISGHIEWMKQRS